MARNWSLLLLNGLLLIVAGVLIFSIDWSVRSLATFIGALFIVEGLSMALTSGIDARVRRANVLTGLLSIAAGIAIIVWPAPGIVAVAIFLGAWLIVVGTITISARSPPSPRSAAAPRSISRSRSRPICPNSSPTAPVSCRCSTICCRLRRAFPNPSDVQTADEQPSLNITTLLSSPSGLRDAIVLREIFGPPRSLQPLHLIGDA